ncbi:MAG: hypothetical protein WBG86_06740 [Polyangiales bacterium]
MKWRVHVVVALTVVVVSACGGSRQAPSVPELTIDPVDLYPLRAGNAWSYDIDTGDASTTLAVTRVESVNGAYVTVQTGGATVQYELRRDGIFVPADGAWLFRAPFDDGATWPARGGRTGEVVTSLAHEETAAGEFQGCLEVRETGGKLGLVVTTIYCPFVGPVSVTSTMPSDVSDRAATVRARLRGYEVAGASTTP